ncbi:hypothetical protein ACIA5A_21795 [Micromonospora sp. NPDC051300]|uniref:hypothetical protein n=1 Tax=Micromonospora sp. NPDC051300 TaxID=3364286 RepID=UPI0037913B58
MARWVARMLASLAVVVAFSLGAAALPAGVSASASTGPAAGLTAGTPVTGVTIRAVGAPAVPRPERDVFAGRQRDAGAERHDGRAAAPQRDLAAARPDAPTGVPEPQPAGAAVPPPARLPVPGGQPSAPAGPRAPPAR